MKELPNRSAAYQYKLCEINHDMSPTSIHQWSNTQGLYQALDVEREEYERMQDLNLRAYERLIELARSKLTDMQNQLISALLEDPDQTQHDLAKDLFGKESNVVIIKMVKGNSNFSSMHAKEKYNELGEKKTRGGIRNRLRKICKYDETFRQLMRPIEYGFMMALVRSWFVSTEAYNTWLSTMLHPTIPITLDDIEFIHSVIIKCLIRDRNKFKSYSTDHIHPMIWKEIHTLISKEDYKKVLADDREYLEEMIEEGRKYGQD